MPRKSHLIAGVAGAVVIAVPIVLTNTANAGEPAQPPLSLVSASSEIDVARYPGDPLITDIGAYVVAGAAPLELQVRRKNYYQPMTLNQVVHKNGKTTTKALPASLVKDFTGLDKFLHVTLTDSTGKKVAEADQSFCPNSWSATRSRPDAPPTSKYPNTCGQLPFTLASVWGLQSGWSVNTASWDRDAPPGDLPDGKYTATATVNKAHRDAFGIPANKATVTVTLNVKNIKDGPGGEPPSPANVKAAGHDHARAGEKRGVPNKPAKSRPVGIAAAPAAGPKPDLRSLPAWQIMVGGAPDQPGGFAKGGPEYLSFAANVWNAGPSPLVVDGFRRGNSGLMDAYQYFYDAKGNQTGYTKAGTLEWDPREGHNHWHFTDFATYRLLDASKQIAVRSGKEAFCLAPTDPVDITVKGANWKPQSTDLGTACGGASALAVRQVLETGWGDTYSQYLPGQSFDVTGLPNGTYYIEVKANPENRLTESNLTNNTSLRKVILGGTPGNRTVKVPPVGLVNAP